MLKLNIFSENFIDLLNNTLNIKNLDKIEKEFNIYSIDSYLFRYLKNNNKKINKKLEDKYKQNLMKNIILLNYKDQLKKELENKNIKFLFYKGIFFIDYIYSSIGDRFLSDIDLLIHKDDLKKLKEIFPENKEKIDRLINYKFYHEITLNINYKGYTFHLDIHNDFNAGRRYPIDLDIFFKKNRIENHLIILINELSSDFFINDEKKFFDLIKLLNHEKIDWKYFYDKIEEFRLKRVTYIVINLINKILGTNYPIIKMKRYEQLLLKKVVLFDNKRWNQLFLYFYIFDSFKDYRKYFKNKITETLNNKSSKKGKITLYKEIQKIWNKNLK